VGSPDITALLVLTDEQQDEPYSPWMKERKNYRKHMKSRKR
jgi:hypothetical protein